MTDITIQSEKVIYKGRTVVKKVSFEQRREDDSVQQQEKEVLDHGNAVAVVLYNAETEKVLLTRQFRLPAYLNGHSSGRLLEACAGLMEDDKNPAEAMKREVEEETGYVINELEMVGQVYTSAGSLTEMIFLFIGPYRNGDKKSKGGGLKEEGEDITSVEIGFDEIKKMLKNKEIEDAKTLILLQYMQLNGLLDPLSS